MANETTLTPKYDLLGSQQELLRMKRDEISRAVETIQFLNQRLQRLVDGIAVELGIPIEDLPKYRLSQDSTCFQLQEVKKDGEKN